MGNESPSEDEFRFHTVGEQLKAERERKSLSLADMAARTKVPMRHLEAIEKSDFSILPGTTYTLGFARSYARAMEMDAAKISADLRQELSQSGYDSYQAPTQNYEPTDPAQVPSRTLAWTAAAIGILVVAAYLFWRSYSLSGVPLAVPQEPASSIAAAEKASSVGTATPVNAAGEVVLTATDPVWIEIYDAQRNTLFEGEMKVGDKFSVPTDANNPMVVTVRPEALAVTIDGKPLPPLGAAGSTVRDLGVSAASLLARKQEVPTTGSRIAPSQSAPT